MTIATIKATLLQVLAQNKAAATASPILAVIIQFIMGRWQADALLFVLVFVAVGLNTISGVVRARQKKEFDPKVLRQKTQIKVVSYLLWLISIYVLALAIQIAAFLDTGNGEPLFNIPKGLIHYPITCTYLFFVLVEALSIQRNLKDMGAQIPNFSTDTLKKFLPNSEDDAKTNI